MGRATERVALFFLQDEHNADEHDKHANQKTAEKCFYFFVHGLLLFVDANKMVLCWRGFAPHMLVFLTVKLSP